MKKTFLVCVALSLAACGGRDKPKAVTGGGSASIPPVTTVTIASLESQGKLPTLDRSNDLKGPDADNNGVRDDIDKWIQSQPFSDSQKKAAVQMAKSLQNTFSIDVKSDAAIRQAEILSGNTVTCLNAQFPSDAKPSSTTVLNILRKYTMNTKDRVGAYIAYSEALNGSLLTIPSGDNCD